MRPRSGKFLAPAACGERRDTLEIIGGAKERLLDAANGPFHPFGAMPEGQPVFPIWINCLPSKANPCLFHFGMVRVANMIPVFRGGRASACTSLFFRKLVSLLSRDERPIQCWILGARENEFVTS